MNLGAFIRFTLINTDHLVRHNVPIADLAVGVFFVCVVMLYYANIIRFSNMARGC